MWILFEFGVVIGGIYTRKKADQEQQDNL
jgi:Sec-independent protein secretion pathway component TatC